MSTAGSRAGGSAGTAATSGGSSSMATALADGHDYGISGASFGTDGSGNAPLVTPGVGSPFYPPQVREDFLLVSEFSEHEGPRPVFTLPDSMLEASHMNLNAFVLRTMAVDYQARVGTDTFHMPADSQMYLTEPDERVFAYVYQFTLYDINARGFVRPVCISFISSDPDKIMPQFEDLTREFSKALALMKEVNLRNFLHELEQRYHDLVYTRGILMEQSDAPPSSSTTSLATAADLVQSNQEEQGHQAVDRDNVDTHLAETAIMIRSIRRRLAGDARASLGAASTPTKAAASTPPPAPAPGAALAVASPTEDLMLSPPVYQPRLIRHFHKSSRFEVPLRNLPELATPEVYKDTVHRLARLLSHYRRPAFVLRLESEEARCLACAAMPGPVPCCLLTIGRTVVLNFAPSHASAGERFSHGEFLLSRSINMTGAMQPAARRNSVTVNIPAGLPQQQADSASCSYESAKETFSLRSASPPYRDAIEAEELFFELLQQESSPTDAIYGHRLPLDRTEEPASRSRSRAGSLYRSPDGSIGGSYQDPGPFQDRDVMSVPVSATVPPPPPGVAKYMPVESFVDHLWHDSRRKPGAGMAKVCRKYSFIKHLIFALLHGRPVLIVGNPENEGQVRSLVVSLAVFVPGHSAINQVLPWVTKPLGLPDLAKVRLAGYSKRLPLSRVLENYVSVLDFEADTLKTPPYHGTYLDQMVGKFASNDAYLAHVHACLLQLAREAYAFYHVCCIANPDVPILRLPGGAFNVHAAVGDDAHAARSVRSPSMVSMPSMSLLPADAQGRARGNTTSGPLAASASTLPSPGPEMSTAQPSPISGGGPFSAGESSSATLKAAAATSPTNPTGPGAADGGSRSDPRRRTARSALTETLRRGRSASRAGIGPPLAGATLEPQMYPPVYAERMRRWEAKLNLHPHDRLILEHFAEVINGQLIHELERVAGGPARTAGGGEDGAATLSEPLRLNFHRPQLFKNGNRTMR